MSQVRTHSLEDVGYCGDYFLQHSIMPVVVSPCIQGRRACIKHMDQCFPLATEETLVIFSSLLPQMQVRVMG